MGTITIGIDLEKLLFSTCSMDEGGHVLQRRELRREAFIAWLPQLAPGTVVAMEACSGAHHGISTIRRPQASSPSGR